MNRSRTNRAGASMRAQPRNRAGGRCYRVVGVWEDARGTVLKKWVMAHGPLTHREGMTVISKTVPRKNTRYMVEETDCLPEYPESLHRALRENRAGSDEVRLLAFGPSRNGGRHLQWEKIIAGVDAARSLARNTVEDHPTWVVDLRKEIIGPDGRLVSSHYLGQARASERGVVIYPLPEGGRAGSRANRAGENPNSQNGFMGWFFRYADLRGRYLHFNGHNPFSNRYDTLQATFINLPTPEVEGHRFLTAEDANHRQIFSIKGFDAHDPAAPAPGKLHIETLSAGPYPRLRAKTGTPEQIAKYLGQHLTAIVASNGAGRRARKGWG